MAVTEKKHRIHVNSKNEKGLIGEDIVTEMPRDDRIQFDTPKKDKLRIMPISDSPWAPTGFGTNTKNVAAILVKDGHHIGYGGCQNPAHVKYGTNWPLGQAEEKVEWENLPIMFPGQERFGEKSFHQWIKNFKPDVVWTHLDFQMFTHIASTKNPHEAKIPLRNKEGKLLSRKERIDLVNQMYKVIAQGPPWKWAATIPFDGQPCVESWQEALDQIDYKICMSRYGQLCMEEEFKGCEESWYIPHGVDCTLFKPIMEPMYGNTPLKDIADGAFVVGCVARNQHRKNIPQLIKGFKEFIDRNDLGPEDAKLILHMDWNDAMGWKFPHFTEQYGISEYLLPARMGVLDAGEALSESSMAHLYNCMDVFVLPTAGEGFGIPTIEAMACGTPVAVTNYTTAWEIIKEDDPETADIPLYPLGGKPGTDEKINGRDHLLEEDICEAGILLPYKDMWWDTPARAAPQRAICSAVAIADALDYYYHNPKAKLKAGKAARAKAKKEYDWPVIEQRWLKMSKVWEERHKPLKDKLEEKSAPKQRGGMRRRRKK